VEFPRNEYLVTTEWLAEHLDDPTIVVLDVTGKLTSGLDNEPGRGLWAQAHIPGSRFFDVAAAKGVLSDPGADLPWMWPSPERFATTLTAHGVGADTRVIIVGRTPRPGVDSGTMWCTRTWWTMHHFGVDCAILRGGIEQWDAEGRPLTSHAGSAASPPAVELELAEDWSRGRASRADVLAAMDAGLGPTCLVDALPAESFEGSRTDYGRPGHITGAVNIPFRSLIERETCGFVDADTMFAVLGDVVDAREVITYCGGAIAATVPAFCLALLGHDGVAVYDGSLMEWAADPDLPMTNPSA
jgi:thiosulfate/3-mercaptopyruvate sulfurtransferase